MPKNRLKRHKKEKKQPRNSLLDPNKRRNGNDSFDAGDINRSGAASEGPPTPPPRPPELHDEFGVGSTDQLSITSEMEKVIIRALKPPPANNRPIEHNVNDKTMPIERTMKYDTLPMPNKKPNNAAVLRHTSDLSANYRGQKPKPMTAKKPNIDKMNVIREKKSPTPTPRAIKLNDDNNNKTKWRISSDWSTSTSGSDSSPGARFVTDDTKLGRKVLKGTPRGKSLTDLSKLESEDSSSSSSEYDSDDQMYENSHIKVDYEHENAMSPPPVDRSSKPNFMIAQMLKDKEKKCKYCYFKSESADEMRKHVSKCHRGMEQQQQQQQPRQLQCLFQCELCCAEDEALTTSKKDEFERHLRQRHCLGVRFEAVKKEPASTRLIVGCESCFEEGFSDLNAAKGHLDEAGHVGRRGKNLFVRAANADVVGKITFVN